MNVEFQKSFVKDLKKIGDNKLRKRVQGVILQVEAANSLGEIRNLRKLQGSTSYYRIRLGNFRLGITFSDDTVTFVRCLHRKEIYRYFP